MDENGPVEIVDLPSYKMGGSFQFAKLLVIARGYKVGPPFDS